MAGLLREGDTCWRTSRADALAFLVDGADYFAAVKAALLRARRSIWLLAWVFDPLTRLEPHRPDRSANPETADRLGLLLRRIAALNPAVDVRVLAWNMPFPIAASQLFAPQRAVAEFLGSRVRFRLDRSLPASACQHQKVLVIDGRLAFVSGGDLSADRWDTCDHADGDRRRRLPNLRRYPARHDVSVMVEGPAALDCARLFAERWSRAGGGRLEALAAEGGDSPWPAGVTPDLVGAPVALVRTLPGWEGRAEVAEGLRLHIAAIQAARRLIYIENQYLTAPTLIEAMARRLAEPDGPEIVVIGPAASPSFFDRLTMDGARDAAIRTLAAADVHGRFRAFCARTRSDEPIIVHSKVLAVDDVFLRIGSANLNNRSGGLDTEADLALEAAGGVAGARTRGTIAAFRHLLVGHYLGRTLAEVEAAVTAAGSLGGAIDALDGTPRRLRAARPRPPGPLQRLVAAWSLGDPASPADAWRPWTRRARLRAQRALIPRVRAERSPGPPPAAGDRTRPGRADRTARRSPAE